MANQGFGEWSNSINRDPLRGGIWSVLIALLAGPIVCLIAWHFFADFQTDDFRSFFNQLLRWTFLAVAPVVYGSSYVVFRLRRLVLG